MSNTIKIYYNPHYSPYDCECYMVYIPKVGMYIFMHDNELFVTDQINFKLDDCSADTYASCRYFDHIVDINSKSNNAIWYYPYDNEESRKNLINIINRSINSIKNQNLYDTFKISNISKIYFSLKKIIRIVE